MTTSSSICPSCSNASLLGSTAAGLCASCGTLSVAGAAVPLLVALIVAIAARAVLLRSPSTAPRRTTQSIATA
jgi:hypothetical protein